MNPPRSPHAYTARKNTNMTIIATTPAAMMSPAIRTKKAKLMPLSSSADEETGGGVDCELMESG
jgi:hypothetical protein